MKPSGWIDCTLGDVVTLQRGHDLPETARHEGAVPVLGSFGVTGFHDESRAPGPGVTVGRSGASFGVVAFSRVPYWPLNTALYVTNFHGNDERFVYYFLKSTDFSSFNSGSAQPSLNRNHIHPMSVCIPERDEQRSIASVLGTLDDKIEQNRRTAQALEKLARAIFRAWFVDYEPVKAKAAGATRFPSMPQPVFDALPTRFVDSAIGPVPQGWEAGAIKDMAALSKTQVKPQEHPEESFDHFSIPAFDAGMRAVVEAGGAIKSNKFLVVDGCVLLSKLNPRIARIWLPPSSSGKRQIASTEFLVFLPGEAADRHYLYCQFAQSEFRDELAQGASGTSNSHQRVRPDDILKHPMALPSASFRNAFANIVDPMFALVSANHGESAKLAELRDYLLPKLLSGQVRVHDAEREVAPVA